MKEKILHKKKTQFSRYSIFWLAVYFAVAFSLSVIGCKKETAPDQDEKERWNYNFGDKPLLIAHAGGGYKGQTYLNVKQALDFNYENGHRYFELDFSWTSDGHLAAIHDWDQTYIKLFKKSGPAPTLKEFMDIKLEGGLTQMSLDEINSWLIKQEDAFIITDIKARNLEGLRYIKEKNPSLQSRFIPQVHTFEQIRQARELGYEKIILTIYRLKADDKQIIEHLTKENVYAVTMPWQRAFFSDLSEKLNSMNICVYAHTINRLHAFRHLREFGVYGVYADFLKPPKSDSAAE